MASKGPGRVDPREAEEARARLPEGLQVVDAQGRPLSAQQTLDAALLLVAQEAVRRGLAVSEVSRQLLSQVSAEYARA